MNDFLSPARSPDAGLPDLPAPAAEWLPALLRGSFCEMLAFDAASLRLLFLSPAAGANLQYADGWPQALALPDIATGVSPAAWRRRLRPLHDGSRQLLECDAVFSRRDGSRYPVALRLLPAARPQAILAFARDLSGQHAAEQALQSSQARLHAIATNTPGLVYQFQRHAHGGVAFPYLSDGCHALLGVTAEQLHADSGLLLRLILADDRASYLASMAASAASLKTWNWEGRIWIEAWKDIKWINLRATPRALADGLVQWEGIMTNITDSKLEQAEIRRSRAQLAELSAHVDRVKEQERTRIAREIHDDLGGNLTAIKMALALLARRLPAGNPLLAEKAAYLDALVDRTIESVHRISRDLRPGVLDFGIVTAIGWQAQEFEKQLGIPCRFTSEVGELDLDADQAIALFRIFQEALTNVGKHAHASRVQVRLARGDGGVLLEIIDDGCGIAATDRLKPHSFGIRGMTERASALGGSLAIGPAPGGGSVVAIRLPPGASGTSQPSTP
ncbi:MAG: histidine kinase [Burkholderiaceae bacterium]